LFFLPGHKLDAERILSEKKKKTLLNSCSCSSFVQVCLCCCNLGKLMIGREGKGREALMSSWSSNTVPFVLGA
jgi:hypothetical protein